MTVTTQIISSGQVRLHAFTRGEPSNPAIVLVHGYPDNHSVWDAVAENLAQHFYVIAYDVRGAGQSDKPKKIADYQMPLLAQDLQAVVDTLIPGRSFHLAAHDWGSIQSWESVTTEALKGRILSYSSVSGPCLDHMGFWMRNHLFSTSFSNLAKAIRQLFSSWYIVFFQLPILAPLIWRFGLAKVWPAYLRWREGVDEPDVNPTQGEDGAIGVRLYRASFISKMFRPQPRFAHCPVQLIVPTGDNYVGTQLFSELTNWVEHLYRRDIDATHWVLLTHSKEIAEWIAEFANVIDTDEDDSALRDKRVLPLSSNLFSTTQQPKHTGA